MDLGPGWERMPIWVMTSGAGLIVSASELSKSLHDHCSQLARVRMYVCVCVCVCNYVGCQFGSISGCI